MVKVASLESNVALSADVSGVEAGIGRGKKSLKDFSDAAQAAAAQASQGFDKMGQSSAQNGRAVDSATRNMIGNIQRTTAAVEVGGRGTREYFELLARQRGISSEVLKPYLAQLDQAVLKQNLARSSADNYGMTAKAAAAAVRGVPAQFTDIVVSLQAGQNPLTVLLQQGGQLKDMFGGAGNAVRALGGYVRSLINPYTAAAAAVAALGYAYYRGTQEASNYARAIAMTGNAAGVTTGQLEEMARRMAATRGTQGAAADALAQFVGSGQNFADLEAFAQTATRAQKLLGQSVADTVKEFAELGKDPLAASIKLNERTHFLTLGVYQQIKALERRGQVLQAGELAQKAYNQAMSQGLDDVQANLGTLERLWHSLSGAAKSAWDAMLNIGRPVTTQDRLDAARRDLEQALGGAGLPALNPQYQLSLLGPPPTGKELPNSQLQDTASLDYQRQRVDALREYLRLENKQAEIQAAQARKTSEVIDLDRQRSKILADLNAQFEAGLERTKARLQTQLNPFGGAEKMVDTLRQLGLTDERTYYQQRRDLLEQRRQISEASFADTERAFAAQQKSLGAKGIGPNDKEWLDFERKRSETWRQMNQQRLEDGAAAAGLVLQEQAAVRALEGRWLAAQQAAQEYLETLQRDQGRAVGRLGLGEEQQRYLAGADQIQDRYAAQRRALEDTRARQELEQTFTATARAEYDKQRALLDEFETQALNSYKAYYAELEGLQANWALGAQKSLTDYATSARNVFEQAGQVAVKAFGGIEDAIVALTTKGTFDFGEMVNAMLADLVRLQVRQSITGPLATAFASFMGGLNPSAAATSVTAGINPNFSANYEFSSGSGMGLQFRASGGPVSANHPYVVGEAGPELFIPKVPGGIVPNHALAGNNTQVTVHVDARGSSVQGDSAQAQALGRVIEASVRTVLVREGRSGGLLARAKA